MRKTAFHNAKHGLSQTMPHGIAAYGAPLHHAKLHIIPDYQHKRHAQKQFFLKNGSKSLPFME